MKLIFTITVITLMSACGGPPNRLYYETTTMSHKALSRVSKPSLYASAQSVLKSREVHLRRGKGRYRRIQAAQVKSVPLAGLWALHVFKDAKFLGAEADMRVWHQGKERVPVSVQIGMDGRIKLDVGRGQAEKISASTDKPRFVNGQVKWTESSKAVVHEAFQLLHPNERSRVLTLPFRRDTRSNDRNKSAQYVQKNCAADIRVYNNAFEADRWQFVGSAHNSRRASVRVVLHEIGHALERHASLIAFCRYKKAHEKLNRRIKRFNASKRRSSTEAQSISREKDRLDDLVKRIEDLTDNSPVLEAYLRVAKDGASPTVYGETSGHESFAESYSLFRADPHALGRVLPKVLAWFERGEHLKAMARADVLARQ